MYLENSLFRELAHTNPKLFMVMICFLAWCMIRGLVILALRAFRFCNILFRGWPPTHLDADGDTWIPGNQIRNSVDSLYPPNSK